MNCFIALGRPDKRKVRLDGRWQTSDCRMLPLPSLLSTNPNGFPRGGPCSMYLTKTDSFAAASWVIEYHSGAQGKDRKACLPIVLDFASDSNPGGGWRSNQTGTQEESLCRCSSLGLSLEKMPYPIPSPGCAYVSDVIVFKSSDGSYLPKPFNVGVVAAALRQVPDQTDDIALRHLSVPVVAVFLTALANGHTDMVLGAWGCGAFGNRSALVCRSFLEVLHRGFEGFPPFVNFFRSITFAVPAQHHFEEFHMVLNDMAERHGFSFAVGEQ
eukprot:c17987_g1_i4.p1 GENE.c17987_g1_i4~~c17987_g1_i4.p1  ORF type:complete len:270 (+),score=37.89 c17987_g1_i4:132-941(+)